MYSSNDLKSKYGENAFIALTNCIGFSVVHDSSMLPSSSPSLENKDKHDTKFVLGGEFR